MPRRANHDLVTITGEVRGESASGLAWRFFDGTKVVWLPKSQCEWDADDRTMEMPEWLAREKELI